MKRMITLQKKLAPGTSFAWSGLSYQENISSGQGPGLYAISVLVVFLCLAALYESWSVPFAVLLVLPLGLIGAVLAVTMRGLVNNIYFQVGLLTTMGLAAKNAILIVEFAHMARLRGASAVDAAMEGARLRLRPILMTSLAFVAGVFPLAVATGAGAQSRIAIGTAVMGGVITGTVLAIFLTPMFFVVVSSLFGGRKRAAPAAPEGPGRTPGTT
jgi:multidrug efflux pump